MTENHNDIVRPLDPPWIEIAVKLDMFHTLDVAIKNFLLEQQRVSLVNELSLAHIWNLIQYSQEIHQECLLIFQNRVDEFSKEDDE
jgi:hypothetical protein